MTKYILTTAFSFRSLFSFSSLSRRLLTTTSHPLSPYPPMSLPHSLTFFYTHSPLSVLFYFLHLVLPFSILYPPVLVPFSSSRYARSDYTVWQLSRCRRASVSRHRGTQLYYTSSLHSSTTSFLLISPIFVSTIFFSFLHRSHSIYYLFSS